MTIAEPEPMPHAKAIAYAVGLPLALLTQLFLPVGRFGRIPGWRAMPTSRIAPGSDLSRASGKAARRNL